MKILIESLSHIGILDYANECVSCFPLKNHPHKGINLSDDNQTCATLDCTLRCVNICQASSPLEPPIQVKCGSVVERFSLSPCGAFLVTLEQCAPEATLWSTAAGAKLATFPVSGVWPTVHFSGDDVYAFTKDACLEGLDIYDSQNFLGTSSSTSQNSSLPPFSSSASPTSAPDTSMKSRRRSFQVADVEDPEKDNASISSCCPPPPSCHIGALNSDPVLTFLPAPAASLLVAVAFFNSDPPLSEEDPEETPSTCPITICLYDISRKSTRGAKSSQQVEPRAIKGRVHLTLHGSEDRLEMKWNASASALVVAELLNDTQTKIGGLYRRMFILQVPETGSSGVDCIALHPLLPLDVGGEVSQLKHHLSCWAWSNATERLATTFIFADGTMKADVFDLEGTAKQNIRLSKMPEIKRLKMKIERLQFDATGRLLAVSGTQQNPQVSGFVAVWDVSVKALSPMEVIFRVLNDDSIEYPPFTHLGWTIVGKAAYVLTCHVCAGGEATAVLLWNPQKAFTSPARRIVFGNPSTLSGGTGRGGEGSTGGYSSIEHELGTKDFDFSASANEVSGRHAGGKPGGGGGVVSPGEIGALTQLHILNPITLHRLAAGSHSPTQQAGEASLSRGATRKMKLNRGRRKDNSSVTSPSSGLMSLTTKESSLDSADNSPTPAERHVCRGTVGGAR